MKKLTKSHEASQQRINIAVESQRYEVAQLLKSGIPNQSVLLIGQDEKWREINLIPLEISNDLDGFLSMFSSGVIKPSDIGFSTTTESQPVNTQPRQQDYESLENDFPEFPYFMISKLYRHITSGGRKSDIYKLKQCLKRVQESGLGIFEWIRQSENGAAEFVAGVKPGEPYTSEIASDGFAVKYFITNESGKYAFQVQSYKNETPGSWFSASAHVYQTIKLAEHDCLSQALVYIRSLITKSETPEIYHNLFLKIQNKFKIINMSEQTKDRENQLAELGLMYNPTDHRWTGHGFTVTGNSIENDNDEIWALTIENIQDYVAAGPQPPEPANNVPASENAPVINDKEKIANRVEELSALGLMFNGSDFVGTLGTAAVAVNVLDIQTYSDRKWTSLMIDLNKRVKPATSEVYGVQGSPIPNKAFAESAQAPDGYKIADGSAPEPPASATQSIEAVNESDVNHAVDTAPVVAPVSLATIGGISTDRISELQDLEKSQLAIVEKHKFVQPVDAKTLKAAKANVTALRKASTGTEKIEKDASKFLNTLKDGIKAVVNKAALITRKALDEQEQAVKEYEQAEAIKAAEEQRKKLEKIKSRTDALFAAGMMRDAASYNIGTVYATPSQIETATYEEFAVILKQAQDMKATLDAEKMKSLSTEEQLAAALAKIAELTGQAALVTEVPAPPAPSPEPVTAFQPVVESTLPPSNTTGSPVPTMQTAPPPAAPAQSGPYVYNTEYIKPDPENYLLARFDMEQGNVQAVNANPIPAAFIKGRALYDRGMKDVSQAIMDILADEAIPGNQKRGYITELCEIILKQK